MPLITDFGSIVAWIIICILLYLFGGQNSKKVAILRIAALLCTNIIVYILKVLIAEPRPFMVLPNVDLIVNETGIYSFPSGHTASSFAAATVIGLKLSVNIKGKNYRLIYPLLAFAVLIGFSRIYIGVHYPLDVIIGALIGISSALLVLRLWNNFYVNKMSKIGLKDALFIKKI
jgi:undecaprenyl-diphosphatase